MERMDYLGAQSNSYGYALSVEKLLGLEMPDRVKWIRILLVELQRINSHLVWLGTHAMDLGAVSVMLYCFRERELILNINEMIAGFRMFPSYIRVGGLREDLPRGFHEAVNALLERLPGENQRVRGPAHQEHHLRQSHAGCRHVHPGAVLPVRAGRPSGPRGGLDLRRPEDVPVRRLRDVRVRRPTREHGDVTTGTCVRVEEIRQSVSICRQAIERITPTGEYQVNDPRVVPPPKDKVYTEMEALIQHFLIYSQGFTVPKGEVYVPIEGPRGEHGVYIVSDGTNRPARVHLAAAVVLACQAMPADGRRRAPRGRRCRHRLDRHRHGGRGPLSFHPKMPYDTGIQKSERKLPPEGEPFAFTPEHRAKFEELATHYPPERRKSAILYAIFMVQEQQGYVSANGDAARRRGDRLHAGGSRRRRRRTTRCSTGSRSARTSCRCAGRSRAR